MAASDHQLQALRGWALLSLAQVRCCVSVCGFHRDMLFVGADIFQLRTRPPLRPRCLPKGVGRSKKRNCAEKRTWKLLTKRQMHRPINVQIQIQIQRPAHIQRLIKGPRCLSKRREIFAEMEFVVGLAVGCANCH